MRVVMNQPLADVDWRQFIAQVAEAPLEKPECQCRFPSARRRGQHTDTTGKRHSRSMKKVEVGASVLERDSQALIEVPQKSVRVLDLSVDSIEVPNTEALCCIAVAPFNLIAARYFRGRPGKGNDQATEGNLDYCSYCLVGAPYVECGVACAQHKHVRRLRHRSGKTPTEAFCVLLFSVIAAAVTRIPRTCAGTVIDRRISRRLRIHPVANAVIAFFRPGRGVCGRSF
jgi:hypothetical protein